MAKYSCFFDRIISTPNSKETSDLERRRKEESKIELEKLREESIKSEEEWKSKSEVVVGIPGRCVIIDRNEDVKNLFVDNKILKKWKEDLNSTLYYYEDIEILSGSTGYVLVCSNGKHYTSIVMLS